MSHLELERLLEERWSELEEESRNRIQSYFQLVVAENEVQNLTKLISPSDFFWGHLWDVREWHRTGWGWSGTTLDLGSGAGIPGIPMACVVGGRWVISESERRKADFIQRAVAAVLPGGDVQVFGGRAEDYLRSSGPIDRIVSRAVGKVEKIYGWIRPCSTWNTLILMKGPQWEQEWAEFQETRFRRELKIQERHEYSVPANGHSRVLIRLQRT